MFLLEEIHWVIRVIRNVDGRGVILVASFHKGLFVSSEAVPKK